MSAEWIRRKDKYHEWYECSYCGMRVMQHQKDLLVDRCPHCRSKMIIKERKDDDIQSIGNRDTNMHL